MMSFSTRRLSREVSTELEIGPARSHSLYWVTPCMAISTIHRFHSSPTMPLVTAIEFGPPASSIVTRWAAVLPARSINAANLSSR
jgi:hypothetical protein